MIFLIFFMIFEPNLAELLKKIPVKKYQKIVFQGCFCIIKIFLLTFAPNFPN